MDIKFRRRLTILRDALLKFPSEELEFNMGIWWQDSVFKPTVPECKIACCALGLATTIPELREQGLKRLDKNFPVIIYAESADYEAAIHFFDLTQEEVWYIFSPEKYDHAFITPIEVAGRISEILNRDLVEV